MPRYINADDLRHMVLYFADARNLNGNHEQAKAYNHCICMIDDEPTADVVEVKHGVWLEDSDGNLICSKCKFKFYPIMFNFCPNCGADMRLKGGT